MYHRIQDMTWPAPGGDMDELEWRMKPTVSDQTVAASIISAYRRMIFDTRKNVILLYLNCVRRQRMTRGGDKMNIEKRFTYHAPDDRKIGQHKMIRDAGKTYARIILHNVPEGREQALAMTKLEEVVMWANAGIARTEGD